MNLSLKGEGFRFGLISRKAFCQRENQQVFN